MCGMVLKVLIAAVYIAAIVKLYLKWRRNGHSVEGNEIMFPIPVFLFALLLPAGPQVLATRIAVQVSLWGICYFWYVLFPKDMWRIVLCVVAFMMFLPVSDYLCHVFFSCSDGIPLVHMFLVVCCHCATFLLWNKNEKFPKNILSLEKLLQALQKGIVFSVAGGGVVCMVNCVKFGDSVSLLLLLPLSMVPLMVLFRYKPHCLLMNDKLALRKKAYVLGKSFRDGSFLEDEGNAFNECIMEDARIIYSIMVLFEKEKLYLNPEIKLIDIARRIGTNKTYLSRALNTRLSKNFCQFVNHYRIREACLLFLKDPGQDMRPLAELCGFSSQSNFSIVFKYNTGFTPGDWSRMVKAKLINNEKVDVDDYLL